MVLVVPWFVLIGHITGLVGSFVRHNSCARHSVPSARDSDSYKMMRIIHAAEVYLRRDDFQLKHHRSRLELEIAL